MRITPMFVLLLLAVSVLAIELNAPVKEVTAYASGKAYIKRLGTANLPAGASELLLPNFTRSAVFETILVSGLTVSEISYYNKARNVSSIEPLPLSEVLNQTLGKTITLQTATGTASGKAVWYADLGGDTMIALQGGGAVTVFPMSKVTQIELPSIANFTREKNITLYDSGLKLKAESSAAEEKSLSLLYLVPGVEWGNNYKFYLTEDKAQGSGYIHAWSSITNNVGEDWNSVSLKLVVGEPHILSLARNYYPAYDTYKMYATESAAGAASAPSPTNVIPSLFAGYYVYRLPQPVTLADGESTAVPLFYRAIDFKREYVWDTNWDKPQKVLKVNNTMDESWASGVFRVYLNGEFIGEDSIDYTAKGTEAEVKYADLSDVTVKKESNQTASQEGLNSKVTTYAVWLTLENKGSENLDLKVKDTLYRWGDKVELISSDPPAKQPSTYELEWTVNIPAGQKTVINYAYSVTDFYHY